MTSYVSLEKEFSKRNEKVKLPGEEATEEEIITSYKSIYTPNHIHDTKSVRSNILH